MADDPASHVILVMGGSCFVGRELVEALATPKVFLVLGELDAFACSCMQQYRTANNICYKLYVFQPLPPNT